jgi:hypothetical protein
MVVVAAAVVVVVAVMVLLQCGCCRSHGLQQWQ